MMVENQSLSARSRGLAASSDAARALVLYDRYQPTREPSVGAERNRVFKKLRKWLKAGRWRKVVNELTWLATAA